MIDQDLAPTVSPDKTSRGGVHKVGKMCSIQHSTHPVNRWQVKVLRLCGRRQWPSTALYTYHRPLFSFEGDIFPHNPWRTPALIFPDSISTFRERLLFMSAEAVLAPCSDISHLVLYFIFDGIIRYPAIRARWDRSFTRYLHIQTYYTA